MSTLYEILTNTWYTISVKISKHVHSCLLIEDGGKVVLVDPGNYSREEKGLSINAIPQLDALVITHEHQDHFDMPTVQLLVAKFPNLPIFTTPSVKDMLANEHIEAQTTGNEFIQLIPVPHEKIWMGEPVPNVMATIFNRFTTPGDSHSFKTTTEILALPVQAPWGSTTRAVELALELKPKVIIPIHDWHWRDEARRGIYARLVDYFAQFGIDFKAVETGQSFDV